MGSKKSSIIKDGGAMHHVRMRIPLLFDLEAESEDMWCILALIGVASFTLLAAVSIVKLL